MEGLGQNFDELIDQKKNPDWGNGGLGRLAACYMELVGHARDSRDRVRHTLRVWNLQTGRFTEKGKSKRAIAGCDLVIVGGCATGNHDGSENRRTHRSVVDATGRYCVRWIPDRVVLGTPCDTLVPGYHVGTVSMLQALVGGSDQHV